MTNRWEGSMKIKHFWRPCVFTGNINGIFNWCWLQLMVTFWVISITGVTKNSKERNLIMASPGKRYLAEVFPTFLNSGSNLFCNVAIHSQHILAATKHNNSFLMSKMLSTILLCFNGFSFLISSDLDRSECRAHSRLWRNRLNCQFPWRLACDFVSLGFSET